MDLSYISQASWRTFEREHQQAYSFLLHAALFGEWQYLHRKRPSLLTAWEKARLAELDHWHAEMARLHRLSYLERLRAGGEEIDEPWWASDEEEGSEPHA